MGIERVRDMLILDWGVNENSHYGKDHSSHKKPETWQLYAQPILLLGIAEKRNLCAEQTAKLEG